MSEQSTLLPETAAPAGLPLPALSAPPAACPMQRLLYWLLRRELWENPSVYLGPLFVAGVVLVGFALFASNIPDAVREISALDSARQRTLFATPFDIAAMALVAYMFMGGAMHSGDALHRERSDRSILFWKSLPVSDTLTILSKALIPLLVLPLLTFALILATQLVMVLVGSAILLADGQSVSAVWAHLSWLRKSMMLLYALAAFALWHAPLYALMMVSSGFGKRAGFLGIVLPALAIVVLENFAFGTDHFLSLIKYRFTGVFDEAFVPHAQPGARGPGLMTIADAVPDPLHYFATPGLWIGLVAAAALLAAAVQVRRYRGPI